MGMEKPVFTEEVGVPLRRLFYWMVARKVERAERQKGKWDSTYD
jgi:hypothetical protein